MTGIRKKSCLSVVSAGLLAVLLSGFGYANIYHEIMAYRSRLTASKDGMSFFLVNKDRQVLHYSLEGNILHRWTPKDSEGNTLSPSALRTGPEDTIYLAAENAIYQFTPKGELKHKVEVISTDQSKKDVIYFVPAKDGGFFISTGSDAVSYTHLTLPTN